MKTTSFVASALLSAGLLAGPVPRSSAQGMPPESRANIHRLFDQHDQIARHVTLTESGYQATTMSTNPVVVRALQAHVKQMSERLESGLMVRRWDPAFAEYVEYYDDLQHEFTQIPNGIKATVTGKTPEAVRVAQNHAQVIADFAAHGWAAHDRSHAAVIRASEKEPTSTADKDQCVNCRAETNRENPGAASDCACDGNGPGPRHGRAK